MATRKRRFNPAASYFSRSCRVCHYCQHGHMDFHEALLQTKHFDINNQDTVNKVWKRFNPSVKGELIPYTTVMQHVRRHLLPAYEALHEQAIAKQVIGHRKIVTEDRLRSLLAGEEGEILPTKTRAEQTLDKYIDEFDRLIDEGKVQITAQSGLQAIKIRADIDKSNKDRKVDIMKAFSGMKGSNGATGVSDS